MPKRMATENKTSLCVQIDILMAKARPSLLSPMFYGEEDIWHLCDLSDIGFPGVRQSATQRFQRASINSCDGCAAETATSSKITCERGFCENERYNHPTMDTTTNQRGLSADVVGPNQQGLSADVHVCGWASFGPEGSRETCQKKVSWSHSLSTKKTSPPELTVQINVGVILRWIISPCYTTTPDFRVPPPAKSHFNPC